MEPPLSPNHAGLHFASAVKKNVGLDSKETLPLPGSCPRPSEASFQERTESACPEDTDEISLMRLSERRSWSLPSCQARRKLKVRRSQAVSFFKSRRDVGISFSLPKTSAEDHFRAVTDQELLLMILRQGLSSGLSGLATVLAVVFCITAVAVPSSELMWAQGMDLQGARPCVIQAWANQLFALLAVCFCFVGCACLVDLKKCKWPGNCQCCDDMVKKSEEAEQRACKAHRAKQQFMAYVFHNIRVPFNAIVLGLGHLRSTADREPSSGEVNENTNLVQMMLHCAETMTSVLDDVTDMGQWEEGVMELNLEEFDLLGVVKFLSWGLKDLLYQKQICFNMHIDSIANTVLASNHVIGDKHRVLQTLGNFLSNAVKFTPAGGRLELSIKCQEVSSTDASILCNSQTLNQMEPLQTQDCSLCPCLRVEGLSRPSKSHSTVPSFHACHGEGSFARVLITVKDTGTGISAEDQAKLFEPYSFVTSGWVQKAGVSGLGLSLAKHFAEQCGGHIGVQSKQGEGSTFYFCLPYPLVPVNHVVDYHLHSKEEGLDTLMEDSQEVLSGCSILGKGNSRNTQGNLFSTQSSMRLKNTARRVLLVEDTEINRIILRKVLENLNLKCDEAENGQVALDLLRQGRTYDIILMDKEMPVMDGHEATRQLRMMGVKTPIVALTGNALQSDRELFLEAGVDDFQTKPLSREKLVQVLARFGVQGSCADRR